MAEGRFTPADIAAEIGITPKECRKYLRSLTKDRAGKGGRWVISPETAEKLIERYPAWAAGLVTEFTLAED